MNPSTKPSSVAEEVTILTYHALVKQATELDLRPPGTRLYVFTLDEFRRQLDHLAAEGFATVSMAELLRWHQGAAELPPRAIVLTFDDGHRSNAELALPELLRRGQKATFFVTAGRIGTEDSVTWDHLRWIRQSGMEVGSHTLTHPAPAALSPKALRRELTESKRVLEEGLSWPVDFVASPTGHDSRHFARLAREAGYKAALQGRIGRNRRTTDLFALRRIVLKRSYGFPLFTQLVSPESRAYVPLRIRQAMRNAVRTLLGVRAYEAARRLLLRRS